MSELKPCPFCGKNPEDEVLRLGRTFAVAVTCPNPDCDPVLRDEWNTRPIEDDLRAEVERLRGLLVALEEVVRAADRMREESTMLCYGLAPKEAVMRSINAYDSKRAALGEIGGEG